MAKKNKQSSMAQWLIGILIAVVMLCAGYFFIMQDKSINETVTSETDFSGVSEIAELATVKCYYHNVAVYQKDPDGLFKFGLGKYGYKKTWIEYTGTIDLGIDFNEVVIEQPDEKGVVTVYVPEAKILDTDLDDESLDYSVKESGILTTVGAVDYSKAISEAQNDMKERASNDDSLFSQAESHAKELIKEYIIDVGEQMGKNYTVKFIGDQEATENGQ